MVAVDDYYMRYEGYHLEAVDDHVAAVTEVSVFDRDSGDLLAVLRPEQRFHPNMLFGDLREAFLAAKQLGESGSEDYAAAVAQVYRVISFLEQRAGREVKTPSTEVAILSSMSPFRPARFGEDFYVTPLFVDPATGRANFRVFVNPMVNFLWLGGLIFVIGAHLAVLPDALERKRLEGAMALEDRAVA
jgi:cytochrome c biogenesis factor